MQPITELDSRYSSPDAEATDWEVVRKALDDAELFWITTVRPDGRPHVTPLVAVWLEAALHFATGADEQKAANLRTNSQVILTTGCSGWQEGLDLVVEGEAVRVTDDAMLQRLARAWTQKWDGSWQYEVQDGAFTHEAGEAIVFRVAPTKVLSFDKGTGAASRHRVAR